LGLGEFHFSGNAVFRPELPVVGGTDDLQAASSAPLQISGMLDVTIVLPKPVEIQAEDRRRKTA
jgi:hypothetical protein